MYFFCKRHSKTALLIFHGIIRCRHRIVPQHIVFIEKYFIKVEFIIFYLYSLLACVLQTKLRIQVFSGCILI